MDESAYIGGDMSQIVANREQTQKREEKQREKQRIIANLAPAYDLFKDIIEKEISDQSNIDTYMRGYDKSVPNGDVIWQEFRARTLYKRKLENLLAALEKAKISASVNGGNDE